MKKIINYSLLGILMIGICVVLALVWPPSYVKSINKKPVISVFDTTNIRIKQWEHYFTNVAPEYIDFKKRKFYHTRVLEMLIESGIPKERAEIYAEIPTIESNWDIHAKSSKGASSMWGLMDKTARQYHKGKNIIDPEISTTIAIKHLKLLDSTMGKDVSRVLFSYNGGSGEIASKMEEYETIDTWLIPFNNETYNFAPKVIGAYLTCKKMIKQN